MDWGRLKPDYPRAYWDKESQQQTNKPIQYESPAITPNRVTYLMTLGRDFLTEKHTLVFEFGGNLVKELLSTLTSDECCGVMLEFEDVDPQKFAQLVTNAPQWTEWMA